MVQTIFIFIHLILIGITWYNAGKINYKKRKLKKESNYPNTEDENQQTQEKIKKADEERNKLIIIGIFLSLGILCWVIANIKPKYYTNYLWFILLIPASMYIAAKAYYSGSKYKVNRGKKLGKVCNILLIISCVILFVAFEGITVNPHGTTEKTTTRIDIVNTNISETGTLVWSVTMENSTDSVYKYYYQQKDGRIRLETIPADDTTVYYLPEGEKQGFVNKIKLTQYEYNNNSYPAVKTDKIYSQSEKYEIWIPKGSIETSIEPVEN